MRIVTFGVTAIVIAILLLVGILRGDAVVAALSSRGAVDVTTAFGVSVGQSASSAIVELERRGLELSRDVVRTCLNRPTVNKEEVVYFVDHGIPKGTVCLFYDHELVTGIRHYYAFFLP